MSDELTRSAVEWVRADREWRDHDGDDDEALYAKARAARARLEAASVNVEAAHEG